MSSVTASTHRAAPAENRGANALLAEFLGTLVLVFAIGAVTAANSAAGVGFTDFVVIGLTYGLTLTVLVATFGRISGGHFNPAVTIAVTAIRRHPVPQAITYILAQLLGAVAAAGLLWVAFQSDIESFTDIGSVATTPELIVGKDGLGGGFIFEAMGTMLLAVAVVASLYGTAAQQRLAPLTVGLALGAANLVAAPFTGGALNPARAFGTALVGNGWGDAVVFLVVYVLAPVVGAVIGALVYSLLLGDDRHRTVTVTDEA